VGWIEMGLQGSVADRAKAGRASKPENYICPFVTID